MVMLTNPVSTDEEESMDITSERSPEIEAQTSPSPTVFLQLKLPSLRDSFIYRKYCNDSHYLFRNKGLHIYIYTYIYIYTHKAKIFVSILFKLEIISLSFPQLILVYS